MSSWLRLQRFAPGAIIERVHDEDEPLVQASQHGDQDAFAVLVQRHQRRVFNLILCMLHDYNDASEVTQEVFVAAWQSLPSLRSEACFSIWLSRLASHGSLRQLERRKREQARHEGMQAEQLLEDAHLEMRAQETGEHYDAQVMVHKYLSQLPTQYRVVLILRHLQERTYEEMAQILTLPVGTIKTQLFRARNLLKQHLLRRQ